MSTLSEHQANENAPEVNPQSTDTLAQLHEAQQHFDILSSKAEKHIFKYVYLYLFGLFLLDTLLFIIFDTLTGYSKYIANDVLGNRNLLLIVVGVSLILCAFNIWQWGVPETLRNVFENGRIYAPAGAVNTNTQDIKLLEHYRYRLNNPRRYLLIGSLMVILAIDIVYTSHLPDFIISHPTKVAIFVFGINVLLVALIELGSMYCIGAVTWTLYISGQYIRKLLREFELRIEPVHPDKCGGLKVLGNFCFGLASPI